MSTKNPSIEARLRRHPDLATTRAPAIVWGGVVLAALILIGWVLLLWRAP